MNLDPNFAAAYAALAGSTMAMAYAFHGDFHEATQACERLARRAITLDPGDAIAHARLSHALHSQGDLKAALRNARKRCRLMPTVRQPTV